MILKAGERERERERDYKKSESEKKNKSSYFYYYFSYPTASLLSFVVQTERLESRLKKIPIERERERESV